MPRTPIQITLYDNNAEIKGNYERLIIPWGILKSAVKLSREIDQENLSEKDVDAIAGLVVEVFGNQFTTDDLDKYADIQDMLFVLNNIVSRASQAIKLDAVNPT